MAAKTQGDGDAKDDDDKSKSSDSSQKDETITVSANVVWVDSDGSAMSEGMPDSVKVAIFAGGKTVDEASVSASTNWSTTFTVPKNDDKGNGINYTIGLAEEVAGYSSSTSVSGNKANIVLKKNASSDSSGDDSSSSASSDSGQASSGDESQSSLSASSAQSEGASSGSSAFSGSKGSASKGAAGKMPSMSGGGLSAGGMSSSGLITEEGATIEDAEEENPYSYEETTLCALMPNDEVSVDVAVDELDINSIVVGADVQVTLDALPGQSFESKISALNPFGQNSGGNTKYTVTVTMGKQENMLLGMSASVGIGLEDRANVLVVPEAALVEQDGKTFVYTAYDEAKDELGNLVEVETGIADGTNAEVTSGLEEGQAYYYRYAGTVSYVFTTA